MRTNTEPARGPLFTEVGPLPVAGRVRDVQNGIGGNDCNPYGADFVLTLPEHVAKLLADLCEFCNSDHLPPFIEAAVAHAQSESIHPFEDGTVARAEPSSTSCSAGEGSRRTHGLLPELGERTPRRMPQSAHLWLHDTLHDKRSTARRVVSPGRWRGRG